MSDPEPNRTDFDHLLENPGPNSVRELAAAFAQKTPSAFRLRYPDSAARVAAVDQLMSAAELRTVTSDDPDPIVRRTALERLAARWSNDPFNPAETYVWASRWLPRSPRGSP
jgi:hypothetical protein